MSKDYKASPKNTRAKRSGAGSLLLGIIIGLLLGLAIALGVAWYVNKIPTPFANRTIPSTKSDTGREPAPEPAKNGKGVQSAETRPRFDFYKILPGSEEIVTDKQLKETPQKASTPAAKEAFFLQAGSFQNADDAENLKARLALLGVEATIQTTTVADKGVWHRLRVGPHATVAALNRVRDTLKQNGIETTLIRVREPSESSNK